MKQLKAVISDALALVKDNYIIFNDGKAVKVNVNKDVQVRVDDYFDSNDYYKHQVSDLEKEIDNNVNFISSIDINEDVDLTVIHINDEAEYLNYNFMIRENVKANIIHIFYKVVNPVKVKVDILCEDYSQVQVKNVMNCEDQVMALVNAYCLNESYIKLDTLALNKKQAQVYTNIFLIDNKTNADLTNVIINSTSEDQVYHYKITHVSEETKSLVTNYGISKNNSNLVMDCDGVIKRGAIKAEMAQKTKGIILDLYSSISAQPILEIDENDVIANHGASIGAIDDDDLYYLMSRGLTREQSENLIVLAFINPYFRGLNDEIIINYINSEINRHL